MPAASDILTFILGFSWAALGFPWIVWSWRLSATVFSPLQETPAFWARCIFWAISMVFLILTIRGFSILIQNDGGASKYGVKSLGAGNICGLIYYVLAIRYGKQRP